MAETGGGAKLSLDAVSHGMSGTHQIFRREFRLMPGLIEHVGDGDAQRAEVLATYVRLLLDLVHVHHEAEERYLWNLLPERAPQDRQIVDTMLEQHASVAELATAITNALTAWTKGPTSASGQAVNAAIAAFASTLVAHADLEERTTVPLITRELTPEEWGAFVGYATTAMPEEVRPTVMGMLLEDMPYAEREAFLSRLPAPVAERIRTTGAEAYAQYTATIRAA